MGELTELFWAMVDSTSAALVGLNPVPVLAIGLFIGLAFGGRLYWLKALVAIIPAVIVSSLWPLAYSAGIIWPDIGQPEPQIQFIILFGLAWFTVRAAALLKGALSLVARQTRKLALSES
jgi:hypothetical protein